MRRIREILLTQYIGAIAIAIVFAQVVSAFIALLIEPLQWILRVRLVHNQTTGSARYPPDAPPYPWDEFLLQFANVLLYFIIFYAMARWLYPEALDAASIDESGDASDQVLPE